MQAGGCTPSGSPDAAVAAEIAAEPAPAELKPGGPSVTLLLAITGMPAGLCSEARATQLLLEGREVVDGLCGLSSRLLHRLQTDMAAFSGSDGAEATRLL